MLLCLNSCGRELEEREFPDTLVIRDSAVPFEKSLQTEQDKSSKYLDYGQVRCVLLEDDQAEEERKNKTTGRKPAAKSRRNKQQEK